MLLQNLVLFTTVIFTSSCTYYQNIPKGFSLGDQRSAQIFFVRAPGRAEQSLIDVTDQQVAVMGGFAFFAADSNNDSNNFLLSAEAWLDGRGPVQTQRLAGRYHVGLSTHRGSGGNWFYEVTPGNHVLAVGIIVQKRNNGRRSAPTDTVWTWTEVEMIQGGAFSLYFANQKKSPSLFTENLWSTFLSPVENEYTLDKRSEEFQIAIGQIPHAYLEDLVISTEQTTVRPLQQGSNFVFGITTDQEGPGHYLTGLRPGIHTLAITARWAKTPKPRRSAEHRLDVITTVKIKILESREI